MNDGPRVVSRRQREVRDAWLLAFLLPAFLLVWVYDRIRRRDP